MTAKPLPKNSKSSRLAASPVPTTIQTSPNNHVDSTALPLELVFGFVGPTGTDLNLICELLEAELKLVRYESQVISLSKIITNYSSLKFKGYYDRIEKLMDAGNSLRRNYNKNEIVAAMGVSELRNRRETLTGNKDAPPIEKKLAYLVRSFKRPEEVKLFRDIYGKAFTLISIYSPRTTRLQHLKVKCASSGDKKTSPEELAIRIERRDNREEAEKFGQRVGQTFPLADYFLATGSKAALEHQLKRLVRLTFGDPYISPTRDEEGMFFAQAAALRSLDLSRQVGAAITTVDGDIITTGCNEVPKSGGGLYWREDPMCERDFELGYDSNVKIKTELVEDAVRRLRAENWLADDPKNRSDDELAKSSLFGDRAFFKDSRLFDVIEFGRAVHAEMSSITQAAKLGIPLSGSKLFCTTFPCHLCARHIVAAGINEVVFIEPYEKSRTEELYRDSISIESSEPSANRVNFRAFVGVAPRRYMDCFQLTGDRKGADGKVFSMNEIAGKPKLERMVATYLFIEAKVELTLGQWLNNPPTKE